MKTSDLFVRCFVDLAMITFVAALFVAVPAAAHAQVAGNNAVYSSHTVTTGSSAFIDASAVASQNLGASDICAKINDALYFISHNSLPGAVIDARGVTSLTCPVNDTPWSYGTNVFSPPSVILLPAGTIGIFSTWILPDRTRIIGEGSGAAGSSLTTIVADSPGFTDPDATPSGTPTTMIRMGSMTYSGYNCSASNNCFGVGIENLVLNGGGQAINGITNVASQELSYVNQVDIYQIVGTGLQIGTGTGSNATKAQNSGPYSNIRFETGSSASAGTTCAQIIGASTRGLHGLSCISTSSTVPAVAVYLDCSSNSIEDVYVSGFGEGIRIGHNAAAPSNVIHNISTPANPAAASPLVHICGSATGSTCSGSASDLSIMGATSLCSTSGCVTIQDDTTGTSLANPANEHVAMYILGEAVTTGTGATIGYSRFTTSRSVPTWIVGSSSLSSGASCSSTSTGTLYSNTTGTLGSTFYVCTGTTWTLVK